MRDIELYIDGKKIDWNKTPDILLTYQRTDYLNPTVTKNMFSKTLTIEGTQNNNNIFSHIWDLERVMDDDFTLFNPSQRVPFELFDNAEIVEKGYAKLDSIKKDGHKIEYALTLYGGLGSFFYALAYDIDSDKEKTLADLNYTSSLNPDDEFDFEINKNTVWNAWDALRYYGQNSGSYKKWDYINFIPCYNGLPEDFDSDRVLINTHGLSGMTVRYTNNNGTTFGTFPTSVSNNDTSYTTNNGFLEGTMRSECYEWEMRDLRSYLQRPCLSVKGLFDAICNPLNNGGYEVNLDSDFFTSGNPYYEKAWITLPMIDSTNITTDSFGDWNWYGSERQTDFRPREMFWKISNIDTTDDVPDILNFNVEIHSKITGTTATTLYQSCLWHSSGMEVDGNPVGDWFESNLTSFQLYINKKDALGVDNIDEVSSSDVYILASRANGYFHEIGSNELVRRFTNKTKRYCFGYWKKKSGSDYVWTLENGETILSIPVESKKVNSIPMVGVYSRSICAGSPDKSGFAYDSQYYSSKALKNAHAFSHLFTEYAINKDSKSLFKSLGNKRSFQFIKKKDLLGGIEGTPCDWFLSYCKLFGLFIQKEKNENVIHIKMRNEWYNNEIVDFEKIIDRSKNIDISPLTFESKWYGFNYLESEGKFLDKYKKSYSQDFGKQLIDTKYNFDADEINILEDTKFRNGMTVLEKSNYFNLKYDYTSNLDLLPCIYDWCTVKYYKKDINVVTDTTEIYVAIPSGTSISELNANTPDEFYDNLPKMHFMDDEKGQTDGDGCLVFFNGIKNTGDVDYWLSDDINEMFQDSDNPCWLQTRNEWRNDWSERIAIKTNLLPEFGRYVLHNNIITASWDFGYTKELYVPYYRYDVNRTPTIYENFWKSYIQDLYSVNTRNVDCYVNLNTNDVYDFMKKFYFWDNSYWVCVKVQDFDIALDRSTLCSFTKVNDISSYLEKPTFDDYYFNFYRTGVGGDIPAQGTDEERSVYFNIDSSSNWVVVDAGIGYSSFDPEYPTSGTSIIGQTIKATFLPNYSQQPRYCTYVAGNYEGQQISITVKQVGYEKPKYLSVEPSFIQFPKEVLQTSSITVSSSADWEIFPNSWTYFTPESGHSGTSAVTVSASTNNGDSQRTANIRINNNDGLADFITIKQKVTDAVTLEQNEIKPVYTVPASGGNVHYTITSDVECTLLPWGGTENFAVASGQVQYNTTIQPTNGTNFWIHFYPNTGTVTRNASFYAYYVDIQGGRHSIFPTIVQLPLEQLASGNTVVELTSAGQGVSTNLGGSGMSWTATTNNGWITLVSTSGSSSVSSIQYTVPANSLRYRTGYIYVTYTDSMGYYCNETIVVNQAASSAFIVTPTEIDASASGGDYMISVTSNTSFNVSSSENWVTFDNQMKNGNFILRVGPNKGYERVSTVNVTSGGETRTITVTQASNTTIDYTLDYRPENIVFESSGGTIQITIRSNSDWTITHLQNI